MLPINKAGRIETRRLSSQAVLDILVRVGERASVETTKLYDRSGNWARGRVHG